MVLSLLHHGTSLTVKNKDPQILLSDPHNNHPKPILKKRNKKTQSISDFKTLKINKQQDLPILHLNISSISANIDDLRAFLNLVNQKCDIICISESTTSTKDPQITNIDLPGFNSEQTPTESSSGGNLIYSPKISHVNLESISRYTALKN